MDWCCLFPIAFAALVAFIWWFETRRTHHPPVPLARAVPPQRLDPRLVQLCEKTLKVKATIKGRRAHIKPSFYGATIVELEYGAGVAHLIRVVNGAEEVFGEIQMEQQ